jgi:hypothetical protein
LVKQVKAVRDCGLERHPLIKTKNLDLLYDLAQRVSAIADESFPAKNQVIIGLGQSPAYLLEMMQCRDQKNNRQNREHKHLAFSGRFTYYGKGDEEFDRNFLRVRPHYEEYLKRIELAPDNLNKENTNFVILDLVFSGTGLESFLTFFKDYPKKPAVIYLQSDEFKSLNLAMANHKLGLNFEGDKLMNALGGDHHPQDRLVARFSHKEEWGVINPLDFRPEQSAQVILNYVQQYVKYKSQPNQC